MEFLADPVTYYLFEKANNILNHTINHGMYQDDSLVVFKVKKSVREIKDCLAEFHQTVYMAMGN